MRFKDQLQLALIPIILVCYEVQSANLIRCLMPPWGKEVSQKFLYKKSLGAFKIMVRPHLISEKVSALELAHLIESGEVRANVDLGGSLASRIINPNDPDLYEPIRDVIENSQGGGYGYHLPEQALELDELIRKLYGSGESGLAFVTSVGGAEANVAAHLGAIRYQELIYGSNNKKKLVLGFNSSYAGAIGSSASISGDSRCDFYRSAMPNSFVKAVINRPKQEDNGDASLLEILSYLDTGTVAAFHHEVHQGSSGCQSYPDGFEEQLSNILKYYGVVEIRDGVMAGNTRIRKTITGLEKPFSGIYTTSKGINNGILPFGLTIFSGDIANALQDAGSFPFGATQALNAAGIASANATLKKLSSAKHIGGLQAVYDHLSWRVSKLYEEYPRFFEQKLGLDGLQALKVKASVDLNDLVKRARFNGVDLFVNYEDRLLMISPVLDRRLLNQLDLGFNALEKTLQEIEQGIVSNGPDKNYLEIAAHYCGSIE